MMEQKTFNILEAKHLLELRIFAYDILRRTFLAEPSKELIQQFQNGVIDHFPLKEENEQLKMGVDQVTTYLSHFEMGEDFDQLHWDYTRMFIGPYELPAPIWESSYMNKDQLLFQAETLQVRRLYLQNNFVSKQESYEAEDHLGLELDYMFQLSQLLLDLIEEKEFIQFHKILLDQSYFLQHHLLSWVPFFREKVQEHAETSFYKGMVNILQGFLLIDHTCMNELLAMTQASK